MVAEELERFDSAITDEENRLSFNVFWAFRAAAHRDLTRVFRLDLADAEDAVANAYLRFRRYAPKWTVNLRNKWGDAMDEAYLFNTLGKYFRLLCRQEAKAIKFKQSIFVQDDDDEDREPLLYLRARVAACQETNCDAHMMVEAVLTLPQIQQDIIFRMADGLTLPEISDEIEEAEAVLRVQRTAALASLLKTAGISLQAALLDMRGKHK